MEKKQLEGGMTDERFIEFLIEQIAKKLYGEFITDNDWLVLIREMAYRGHSPATWLRLE